MPCLPLSDVEAWMNFLGVQVDLRACLRLIVDQIDLEIPNVNLDFVSQLENALLKRLAKLNLRIAGIQKELGCITIVWDGLSVQPPIPDFLNFMNILREREAALNMEIDEIRNTIERIPEQLLQIERLKKELLCQKGNSNFLSGILDTLPNPLERLI